MPKTAAPRLALLLVLIVGTLVGAKPQCPPPEPGVVVMTDRGPVRGATYHETHAFLGIPYAAPPVGDLRWRPTEDVTPWGDPLDATAFGNICQQGTGSIIAGPEPRSEDCLTLNVWTPAEPPMEPLPVMVWLHGGGNVSGSSSFTIYDGRPISEQGRVVFVSVNYRLGAFGFMAHAALSAESPEGASGNYGLLDQIAALRWVQRNAAAFGGDPDTVTLLGESAGGTDTCMLLTSPLAAGLFHRAIVESGSCRTAPLAAREAQGAQLAALMGCDGAPDAAACMRGRTDLEVLAAQEGILNGSIAGFGPAVDGYVLPQDPREVFAAGAQQPVPVIMGANENEMELLLPFTFDHGRAAYEAFVAETYRDESPETIAEILARYPYTDTWNFRDAASAVTTDTSFLCPLRRNLRALVATHPEAVYRYHFTRVLDTPILRDLKAFHGLEVMFALDTLGQIPLPYTRNNPTNDALITAMVGYWSRFAHTGDPNGPGAVPWPTYEPVTDRYLELGDSVAAGEGVHADHCDFWDSLE